MAAARGRALLSGLRAFLSRRALCRPPVALWELILAFAAGLALSLAYVGPMIPEVAFVAPAVFLYVISREPVTPGAAGCLGLVFGLAFFGVGAAWIGGVTWLGWAGAVLGLAAPFAALAATVSFVCRKPLVRGIRLPVVAVAPVAWVAVEYARSLLFTGIPWLYLGHAFSERLVLIQVADIGGAYLVTFVAALVASAAADLARQWGRDPVGTTTPEGRRGDAKGGAGRLLVLAKGLRRWGAGWGAAAAAATAVGLTLAYGAYRLATVTTVDGPRLVLVQGNIHTPGAETEEEREQVNEEIVRVHRELSRGASGEGELLVWSESMIYCYYNDPDDPDAATWRGILRDILGEAGLPLLAGSSATDKGVPGGYGSARRRDYNSAFLLTPTGEVAGRYDKIHLVPFGEYVPLAKLPFFASLTPYAADDPGYSHGSPAQPLLEWRGPGTERAWRFGVLICYEDVFADLARRASRLGADFLVNLSSEVWFAGSAEIRQHFRISRFRAVETRLSLVRCCNVGVTCFIGPAGRVRAMLPGSDGPGGARGTVSGAVPVRAMRSGGSAGAAATLYTRMGDAFALAAGVVILALLGLALVAGRRAGK